MGHDSCDGEIECSGSKGKSNDDSTDNIINFDLNPNSAMLNEDEEAESPKKKDDWKTQYYWTLPENVRNAIDRAKEK